jgi:hypothetical protein
MSQKAQRQKKLVIHEATLIAVFDPVTNMIREVGGMPGEHEEEVITTQEEEHPIVKCPEQSDQYLVHTEGGRNQICE